jgi:hypothetical protein
MALGIHATVVLFPGDPFAVCHPQVPAPAKPTRAHARTRARASPHLTGARPPGLFAGAGPAQYLPAQAGRSPPFLLTARRCRHRAPPPRGRTATGACGHGTAPGSPAPAPPSFPPRPAWETPPRSPPRWWWRRQQRPAPAIPCWSVRTPLRSDPSVPRFDAYGATASWRTAGSP